MTKTKRFKRQVGDVIEIPLGDNRYGYGRILEDPLYAFYDVSTERHLAVEEVVGLPILFKIWVRDEAVKNQIWKIIGNKPLQSDLLEVPKFFKKDPINKKLSIYWKGKEVSASKEECAGLECAAVWDAEHVEDRLRDHFAGKPNRWVESMRP